MCTRPLAIVWIALIVALQTAGPSAQTALRPPGPLRIVLLVDSSEAVSRMVSSFRAGLRGFLEELPGEPEIAIITTGRNLRILAAPTSDRRLLEAASDTFTSDGGANTFLRTLLEADARFLQAAPNRRPVFVILATDANDAEYEGSGLTSYNEFLSDFVARGGRAHAIIVRDADDPNGLQARVAENLAMSTGGFFETVLTGTAVPKLMRTVAGYVAADQ